MKPESQIKYKRILLKLSGEALAGSAGHGIDTAIGKQFAAEIAEIHKLGVEIGIVIGGGNFMRGASATAIARTSADAMGMLATVMNSLALQSFLAEAGCDARLLTAVTIESVGERFSADRARKHLARGRIVIIAGGTGSPFFTTDTAAALRSAEIAADVLLKATKVDGVYDCDPVKNPKAVKFDRISHADALAKKLKVMDATAFSFCMENNIPIIVFKLSDAGSLRKCVLGKNVGSIVNKG
jgi:uridylate kinase